MRHHSRVLISLTLVTAAGLAGCGGSKSTPSSAGGTTSTAAGQSGHVALPARATPSTSAKMICESEVQDDLVTLLGVKTTKPLAPTWTDHAYSCTYTYAGGSLTLSVKELSDQAETDSFFASEAVRLGKAENINGLGQGAFTTKSESAVVRKDYKVLLVDVSGLPAEFGTPPDTKGNIALNVAATIMGCWTGA